MDALIITSLLFPVRYGVVSDNGWNNVTIRFCRSGFVKSITRSQLKKGNSIDPTEPSVYGVGFLGVGKYTFRHQAFTRWHNILYRCYGTSSRAYKNCYVCAD